jgi:hypothetical protein
MKKFSILSVGLLIILTSCAGIPEAPEVWQCQLNGTPRKFFCINTRTKEEKIIPVESEVMKSSQCLSADDYEKAQSWVKELIRELKDCKAKQ